MRFPVSSGCVIDVLIERMKFNGFNGSTDGFETIQTKIFNY